MKIILTIFVLISILSLFTLPVVISSIIAFSPDSFLTIPTNNWTLKWFYEFFNQTRWTEALLRSLAMATLSHL